MKYYVSYQFETAKGSGYGDSDFDADGEIYSPGQMQRCQETLLKKLQEVHKIEATSIVLLLVFPLPLG